MADQESEAALAVFFGNSVTTITNWCKGLKLPKGRDIEDLVGKCGILRDELISVDERSWQLTLKKVLSKKRILITPGWLHDRVRMNFVEVYTQSNTIFILTVDAHNDTQRRDVQDIVKNNIARGINYIYIIPSICENERSLIRFVESINSHSASNSQRGTAKILKTHDTKNTTHQWKRIDHVMLFAYGDDIPKIECFADIPLVQIDEGYEQLFRASDPPYGEFAWKSLSIREIDYYKELLEEWGEFDGQEKAPTTKARLNK